MRPPLVPRAELLDVVEYRPLKVAFELAAAAGRNRSNRQSKSSQKTVRTKRL